MNNKMKGKHLYWFSLLMLLVFSCNTSKKADEEKEAPLPIEVPPSYLNVRVNFPVNELEEGVNKVLPMLLIDGAFPMKDDKDTLFLKIKRTGNLNLTVRNNEVFASIPLKVTASAKKKVFGITFSNKDSPVTFSGIVKASAIISLKDDWEMDYICSWERFDFIEEPNISLMGLNFNVGNTIKNVVDDYSDNLSDVICRSLRKSVSFREILNKVWIDLQATHRIAENPKPLYLRNSPVALNGMLIAKSKDTLSIHMECRTQIYISPENRIIINKMPLNKRAEPLSTKPSFLAYPELNIPYKFLEETLREELTGKLFKYEKYMATITGVGIKRKGQFLKMEIATKGDLNGKIYITGKPVLNDQMELGLEEFKYQIEADSKWINMTDFALHQFVEEYISEQIIIEVGPFFKGLDRTIMEKISNSNLGSKLDLRVSFDKISTYNILLTETGIQWILFVEGETSLNLKGGLLNAQKDK